jgi:hypothetical protein
MTDQFPDATKMVPLPPPELVQQWMYESNHNDPIIPQLAAFAALAAQWGADQELDACCEWFANKGYGTAPDRIRMHRRPEPPSVKEQALLQLDTLSADLAMHGRGCDLSQIRRALEALPND